MSYDFSHFKEEADKIAEWLAKEFSSIRTGQATPALLDNIKVESYGAMSEIAHVASVTTEDARTLRIAPWDKSVIKDIEKAITMANLGVSVTVDDIGIRVGFPELTVERRELLKKTLNEKLEKAKISIRGERENVINDLTAQEKEGDISEDVKFRSKEELQKLVDAAIAGYEAKADKKEVEINE